MARLLRDLDYLRLIQADNLDQVIEGNQSIKLDVEQVAQTEMITYLAQRYIVGQVFTNTSAFSLAATYKGKNLVEYTATAFSAAIVYTIGQRVLQAGYIYSSIAGSAAHAFNVAEWTLLCADKALFYVTLPKPEFNILTTYAAGNEVWYNDIVYTCAKPVTGVTPDSNTYFWTAGSTYTITATYPTDATKWTAGDNRNPLIVSDLIDVTLYHLHSRINPRNIPELRKERYDGNNPQQNGGVIARLKRFASGDLTADLPNILPQQGVSISYGSKVPQSTNSY